MNDIKDADIKLQAGIEETRQKLMRNINPHISHAATTRNSTFVNNMRQNLTR